MVNPPKPGAIQICNGEIPVGIVSLTEFDATAKKLEQFRVARAYLDDKA